jgi:hypothetical protein
MIALNLLLVLISVNLIMKLQNLQYVFAFHLNCTTIGPLAMGLLMHLLIRRPVIPSILYSDRNGYKLFPDGEGEFYACY